MPPLHIDGLYDCLGWYGKLPAAGDFVHRRMDMTLINFWHQWLSQSLQMHKQQMSESRDRDYRHAPIWNFLLPVSSYQDNPVIQLGCIAPSQDRVGRLFPLLVTLAIPAEHYHPQLISGAARYLQTMGRLLLVATQQGCSVPQFDAALRDAAMCMTPMVQAPVTAAQTDDAILSILNFGHEMPPVARIEEEQLAWPDLAQCFHPYSQNSYWWTNQATGAAHRALVHGGGLSPVLFSRLFGAQA